MESIEYYKSLISDEEVIKALVKESKSREGESFKEKTRVRPNLNFFQRTVTNLVSSNKRITTIPEFIPKERNRSVRKVKTPRTLMREIIMTNKINFVKSEESKTPEYAKKSPLADVVNVVDEDLSSNSLNECFNRSENPPKLSTKSGSIHFNLNFDKYKFDNCVSSNRSRNFSKYEKREPSTSSDSSDASIISISSTDSLSSSSLSSTESEVITISDSDEDSNSNKPERVKDEKVCRKKCKRKLQKRRKKRKDV